MTYETGDDRLTAARDAKGRDATRDEVLASIESGLPILQDSAAREKFSQRALEVLRGQYETALQYVPGGAL